MSSKRSTNQVIGEVMTMAIKYQMPKVTGSHSNTFRKKRMTGLECMANT